MLDEHDRILLRKIVEEWDREEGTSQADEMMDVMLRLGDVLRKFTIAEKDEILQILMGERKAEELTQSQIHLMILFDDLGGLRLYKDFSRRAKGPGEIAERP